MCYTYLLGAAPRGLIEKADEEKVDQSPVQHHSYRVGVGGGGGVNRRKAKLQRTQAHVPLDTRVDSRSESTGARRFATSQSS